MDAVRVRRGVLSAITIVAMIVSVVAIPDVGLAASPCRTSGGGSYQVTVCLTAPTDGATVAGVQTVATTVSFTGSSPGVRRAVFYLNGEYLLTDVSSPYTFELPTSRWVDGTYLLEAELLLRDGFVSSRASVDLTFANGVTTPPVNTNTFNPRTGSTPPPGQPFVLAATGDGAGGRPGADAVAGLISGWNPNMFLYLGDVYEKGTPTEFFNWYGHNGQRYSAFADVTNPIVGNHEYENGVAPGYFDYWDNVPNYYSYDAAGWHFIALNSTSQFDQRDPGSAQYQWLAADLAASSSQCTIAYFHHPVVSVGPQGDSTALNDIWRLLSDNGVDVVLTGHDHQYQRWVPLDRDLLPDPNGITQFVAGGGGHGIQAVVSSDGRVAAVADSAPTAYGSLKLELNPDGATFAYVNSVGAELDAGVIPCRESGSDMEAPTTPGDLTASPLSHYQVALAWSASTDNIGVASYTIYRDGAEIASTSGAATAFTDETAAPETTYSYEVDAVDQAGNHSPRAGPAVVTTDVLASSITYQPVADAYVNEANPASKYGSSTLLRVDASPLLHSYLRFDVAGLTGPPAAAKLRVFTNSSSPSGYEVHGGATNNWDESTITYATAPGFDSTVTGTSGAVSAAAWSEVDVTSLIPGNGTYTVVLTGISTSSISLASRESANPPELVIATGSGPPVNQPPVVGAGPDQSVGLAAGATLDGSVSDDGLPGGGVSTTWTMTSGPPSGSVTFGDVGAIDTTAGFSVEGVYVLRLTADDGDLSAFDELSVTVTAGGASTVVEVRVAGSSDDAEESSSGSVSLTSSDLELVQTSSLQTVGMRFGGVAVPPGATIVDAYVQFQVDETDAGAVALTVAGQAADNAPTFTSGSGNVSSRPRTGATVGWSPPAWSTVGAAGAAQRTPNLAAVVQEIVGRSGWSGGNSLVLIITGSGKRVAESYNGSQSGAPLLHIAYTLG